MSTASVNWTGHPGENRAVLLEMGGMSHSLGRSTGWEVDEKDFHRPAVYDGVAATSAALARMLFDSIPHRNVLDCVGLASVHSARTENNFLPFAS
ncbi:MAG TPA: hypothetical protein VLI55_15770 [Bryobacteraceae bacterium]|nr:hypothetical protein [Bryobacteraceae bacterium]